jgi:hypothetical protein
MRALGGIAAIALVLAACETQSSDVGDPNFHPYYDACRQFTTCGTCTPVEGCGWCFDADGRGLCAASPDECLTPAFSWTWNETGCRIPADAATGTVVAEDAGVPQSVDDAEPPQADASNFERDQADANELVPELVP